MMSKPQICVIVAPAENTGALSDTLASIRAQTFSDYQVIVASSSESLAASRNQALQETDAEWIAFIDAGQTWSAEKLSKQHQLLSANPDLNWCYCAGAESHNALHSGQILRALLLKNFISAGSVVVRRKALLELGGFTTHEAFAFHEDWHTWLRLAGLHAIGLVAEPLIHAAQPSGRLRHEMGMRSVIESIVNAFPEQLKDLRSEALAQVHIAAGNARLLANQRNEARLQFAEALTHDPMCSDAYVSWMSSFLSSEAQQQIRDLQALSKQMSGNKSTISAAITRVRDKLIQTNE